LWHLPVSQSQGAVAQYPAHVFVEGLFIVEQPAGAISAFELRTGERRWTTGPQPCPDVQSSTTGNQAELAATDRVLVVAGNCAVHHHRGVRGLDPATGRTLWSFRARYVLGLAGNAGMVAVPVTQVVLVRVAAPRLNTPAAVAAADPAARLWSLGGYEQSGQESSVLAVDADTGQTRWHERLVPQQAGVLTDAGLLCWVLAPPGPGTPTGFECRNAQTGDLLFHLVTAVAEWDSRPPNISLDSGYIYAVEGPGLNVALVVREELGGNVVARVPLRTLIPSQAQAAPFTGVPVSIGGVALATIQDGGGESTTAYRVPG
jgi:hypothetical protein